MAGEAIATEALARVEHKVDLLLEMLTRLVSPNGKGTFMLTPVGQETHVCPVCTQTVGYMVDLFNKSVARRCGCKTGKVPPMDLGVFAPPTPLTKQDPNQQREELTNELAERSK